MNQIQGFAFIAANHIRGVWQKYLNDRDDRPLRDMAILCIFGFVVGGFGMFYEDILLKIFFFLMAIVLLSGALLAYTKQTYLERSKDGLGSS